MIGSPLGRPRAPRSRHRGAVDRARPATASRPALAAKRVFGRVHWLASGLAPSAVRCHVLVGLRPIACTPTYSTNGDRMAVGVVLELGDRADAASRWIARHRRVARHAVRSIMRGAYVRPARSLAHRRPRVSRRRSKSVPLQDGSSSEWPGVRGARPRSRRTIAALSYARAIAARSRPATLFVVARDARQSSLEPAMSDLHHAARPRMRACMTVRPQQRSRRVTDRIRPPACEHVFVPCTSSSTRTPPSPSWTARPRPRSWPRRRWRPGTRRWR